jgi:hypothetical protein
VGRCFFIGVLSAGSAVLAQESAGPTPAPDDAALEAAGAVIGEISIHAGEIFDTDDPKENKRLFRAANKLHINTRERVIRRQLTFATGDRYSRAALDESERNLRHNGYLYDASIRATSFDGTTVAIGVWTRDVWTLRPAAGFHRSGGVNTIHFGLHDANFLGLGKSLEFERPFWRIDEEWAGGVQGDTDDRTDYLYALGEVIEQFQEQRFHAGAYFGQRMGGSARTAKRLLVGYTYDRSIFGPSLPADPLAAPPPPNRTLSYPWIGVSLIRDAFVRAHDMDKLGRTEDVNLGLELNARLGWAAPEFGADRSAAVMDFRWHNGFSPGQGQIITVGAGAKGRMTNHGVVEDGLVDVSARYYHRDGDARLFFMSVTGAAAANLDPDHQLLLGGDNGLRGYPLRYALGDKSILLSLEERFYVQREFFHMLRIGGAVFADVGKAWSEAPIPAAHLGVLKDVGVGLRFGQTRSAHAAVVRVDVAVPFDAIGGGLHPQILVTTGETF